jgi:hypothetical protein
MASTSRDTKFVKSPVLSPTRYDAVWSAMIVIVSGLAITVFFLIMLWLSNRPVAPPAEPPIIWVEDPGGDPDGAPDETFQLDAAEEIQEEVAVEETIENVIELSEAATQVVQPTTEYESEQVESGKVVGTGRRPLGDGPGNGGYGREQRWFVRFADGGTIDEYARQLDYFKIELGALLPDKSLVYLTNLSEPQPTKRVVTAKDQAEEKRLYMVWRTAGRRKADEELFQKAGIDARGAIIMHFYPPEQESALAKLEEAHRQKKPKDILRTYFTVRADGAGGYVFQVAGQQARS